MEIKKIKQLAKLANNNPSDSEANLAARKLCELLAKDNFSIEVTGEQSEIGYVKFPGAWLDIGFCGLDKKIIIPDWTANYVIVTYN